MPISTQWIVQDRVILTVMSGIVSEEEINEWLANQVEMVASGQAPVHHISDGLSLEKMDVGLATFQKMINAIPRSSNFGWHIEVTTNPLSKMTSAIVSHFARVNSRTYPSRDKAIAFLRENDASLEESVWRQI